jgi:hypothetical protein
MDATIHATVVTPIPSAGGSEVSALEEVSAPLLPPRIFHYIIILFPKCTPYMYIGLHMQSSNAIIS